MEREACVRQVEDLVVRYEGKCSPCQGFKCSNPHEECHIDLSSRQPLCDCNTECANETAPVCASNGKTVSLFLVITSQIVFIEKNSKGL